jgi:hypothetical protein
MTDRSLTLEHRHNPDPDAGGISSVVEGFMGGPGGVGSHARVLSWDFCFEHFADLERVRRDRQASCMQLGYYLASWGMLRGSSYLFRNTNARHYLQALDVIERYTPEMDGLTPARFGEQRSQELLVSAYQELAAALLPKGGRQITLVTKTMMGVWGVFPSLDSYFMRTFGAFAKERGKGRVFSKFGVNTVELIGEFYDTHQQEIDRLASAYQTVDFASGLPSGLPSGRNIPAAKVIDIYGFGAAYYR